MPTPAIDIYPKSRTAAPDWKLFENPTAEYRGAPFWAWNNRLDQGQLLRQMDILREMGFGGAHLHVRTGLDTAYLGDEYMAAVRACVEKARATSMLCWLYDEDRWPSGFAGGLVTCDPRHRARHLLFTPRPYAGRSAEATNISNSWGSRAENGQLLARYEVQLRDGRLAEYRRLDDGDTVSDEGTAWYAYLETAMPTAWYNNQTYVDTLSKDAIGRFVDVTHERYLEVVGDAFGEIIPTIFTDEPQFTHKRAARRAEDTLDLFLPWTEDLCATFAEAYGKRLEDSLPEVFWERSDGRASVARYRYHDHVCERFAAAFADTIGDWCSAHGIGLTGHMMEEPTLGSQTAALGEAMRSYRAFHVPGIDILCDSHEYSTAKQAQSAAHQYGRPGVLSELYGVTNWDFDFVGHKAQGDWQAALGVTLRVPHLTWVSMAGEAKRDYPASIGYQSPWYREYPLIEDHFARVNTVLTRGEPRVRLGVIHPIESYWLTFGPQDQTAREREAREGTFDQTIEWLLFGLVDFDFIAESLLPDLNDGAAGQQFRVGAMAYDAILVPPMRTIRSTTLERLEAFAEAGGDVVFAGEVPSLVDAESSDQAQRLAAGRSVGFSRPDVLRAVERYRDVEAWRGDGAPADSLLYQMRQDGDNRFAFFVNTDRLHPRADTRLRFTGEWVLTLLDTRTGERSPLSAVYEDGRTTLEYSLAPHGHLLLMLEPGRRTEGETRRETTWTAVGRLADPVPVTLSEPNVLLLDQAEYRFDGGAWHGAEETLRIENIARAHFGLPENRGGIAQPWTDASPVVAAGRLELKFTVTSDVDVISPLLALEDPEDTEVLWDGETVPVDITGWWVDEAIRTLTIPRITAGTHALTLRKPFTRKSSVEWCYILGDFGVQVAGRRVRIIAPVRELAFGDWTRQGLPFYAGNVTYHCAVEGTGAEMAVRATKFRAPLLSVERDGQPAGKMALAPFRAELGKLTPGSHGIDITAYGNRFNAFGHLHHAHDVRWAGPDAWRSEGDAYCYEYQIRPMGVLVAPTVETA